MPSAFYVFRLGMVYVFNAGGWIWIKLSVNLFAAADLDDENDEFLLTDWGKWG